MRSLNTRAPAMVPFNTLDSNQYHWQEPPRAILDDVFSYFLRLDDATELLRKCALVCSAWRRAASEVLLSDTAVSRPPRLTALLPVAIEGPSKSAAPSGDRASTQAAMVAPPGAASASVGHVGAAAAEADDAIGGVSHTLSELFAGGRVPLPRRTDARMASARIGAKVAAEDAWEAAEGGADTAAAAAGTPGTSGQQTQSEGSTRVQQRRGREQRQKRNPQQEEEEVGPSGSGKGGGKKRRGKEKKKPSPARPKKRVKRKQSTAGAAAAGGTEVAAAGGPDACHNYDNEHSDGPSQLQGDRRWGSRLSDALKHLFSRT